MERDLRDLFCLNANVRVGVSIATFCSLDVDSLVHFPLLIAEVVMLIFRWSFF